MKYFIVKNISTSDRETASNSGEFSSVRGVDNYDLVAYESSREFSEGASAQLVSFDTFEIIKKSPVFTSYEGKSIEEIQSTLNDFIELEEKFLKEFRGFILTYLIAKRVPTGAQKSLLTSSFVDGGLQEIFSLPSTTFLEDFLPLATGLNSLESCAIAGDPTATDALYGWSDLRDYLSSYLERHNNTLIK